MASIWRSVDGILRGEATRLEGLRRGEIEIPAGRIGLALVPLAMSYGACMGSFSVFRVGSMGWLQVASSAVKVPILFALTLLVTFPSLYVFNALVGSRLTTVSLVRLLVSSMAVTVAALASFGPIVAFFSASTTSYSFMVLLNVAVFSTCGLLGMRFLLQTLHRLSIAAQADGAAWVSGAGAEPGPLGHAGPRGPDAEVRGVFRCWIVVFGLVGSQMGWILRPFIGHPDRPFVWLRGREANVFAGIWQAIVGLVS